MNAPLKAIDGPGKAKLEATMRDIGRDARLAAHALALAPQPRRTGRSSPWRGDPRVAGGDPRRQ